jgi:hypothetical protein
MPPIPNESRDNAIAEEIAGNLFQIMVLEYPDSTPREEFGLPEELRQKFLSKLRLYHEATILLLLLSQAEKGRKYELLLRAFEGRLLPSAPSDEGISKLRALKSAMRQISELVQPPAEPKPLSWGMEWFADIGHELVNPVTLTLVANYWVNAFVAVGKAVEDLRPLLEDSD